MNKKFALVLCVCIATIFSNTVNNEFVWDDHAFIEANAQTSLNDALIGSLAATYPVAMSHTYRPVRNIFYAITIPFFGQHPGWYHALTLGLHILCSLLVYALASRLLADEMAARASAMLFGLHPLHAQNVYWITAGYDLIFVVFALLSLINHFDYFHRSKGSQYRSFVYAFMAMLANEIALVLPLIIIGFDWLWFKVCVTKKQNATLYLGYFLLSGIVFMVRSAVVGMNGFNERVFTSLWQEGLLAVGLLGLYLKQFVIPWPLTIDPLIAPGLTGLFSQNHNLLDKVYPTVLFSQSMLVGIVVGGIYGILLGWLIYRQKPLSALMLFSVLALLPVLRVMPLPIIYADRYAYLATVAFCLIVGYGVSRLKQHRQKIEFVIWGGCLFFGAITYSQANIWQSDRTLWEHTLKHNPESAVAYSSLGVVYYLSGDLESSYIHHRTAAEMNPYMSSYQQNYLASLSRLKKYPEMIEFIDKIIQTDRRNVDLYTIAASVYDAMGNYDQAMANYQRAYDLLTPTDPRKAQIKALVSELDKKYHRE